jgi:integrase
MKILRHSQISITMEIYIHVTDDQRREALRKPGDALG